MQTFVKKTLENKTIILNVDASETIRNTKVKEDIPPDKEDLEKHEKQTMQKTFIVADANHDDRSNVEKLAEMQEKIECNSDRVDSDHDHHDDELHKLDEVENKKVEQRELKKQYEADNEEDQKKAEKNDKAEEVAKVGKDKTNAHEIE